MEEKWTQTAKELEDALWEMSRTIHQNPELGFEEHKAQSLCADLLEKEGFSVEKGTGGVETAFKARFPLGNGQGPRVAFLAEYDCLPGLGHACGHNLIAGAAVGAGILLRRLAGDVNGEVVVMGTPAEEGGGGKVIMLENGAFDDVGYAIMMHPSTENLVGRGGRATVKFDIAFHGKGCHSAGPEKGINALNALILLFNAIDNLRPLLPTDANINGVILDGGKACNVIPDYAHAQFSVRVRTQAEGEVVMEHLRRVIQGVEQLTGARAEYVLEPGYAERYPNDHIEREIQKTLEELGEEVERAPLMGRYGSSDIGNVTLKMPAVHTYFKIAPKGVASHTPEFEKASNTPYAYEQMMKAALAMARAASRILSDEEFRSQVDEEFAQQKKAREEAKKQA